MKVTQLLSFIAVAFYCRFSSATAIIQRDESYLKNCMRTSNTASNTKGTGGLVINCPYGVSKGTVEEWANKCFKIDLNSEIQCTFNGSLIESCPTIDLHYYEDFDGASEIPLKCSNGKSVLFSPSQCLVYNRATGLLDCSVKE